MSALEIIQCEQGTDEWFQARLGVVTASEFATVCAKGRGGAASKTRRDYMLKLIGESITGEVADRYTNQHMERGHQMEPVARRLYAERAEVAPRQVGFIRNGRKGCSPDSLIDANGMVEIKSKLPHLQIEVLLAKRLPPQHVDQVQGQLWVAEREWCDFVSYWPGLPLFVIRVWRDEEHIRELSTEVDVFVAEMDSIKNQVLQEAA